MLIVMTLKMVAMLVVIAMMLFDYSDDEDGNDDDEIGIDDGDGDQDNDVNGDGDEIGGGSDGGGDDEIGGGSDGSGDDEIGGGSDGGGDDEIGGGSDGGGDDEIGGGSDGGGDDEIGGGSDGGGDDEIGGGSDGGGDDEIGGGSDGGGDDEIGGGSDGGGDDEIGGGSDGGGDDDEIGGSDDGDDDEIGGSDSGGDDEIGGDSDGGDDDDVNGGDDDDDVDDRGEAEEQEEVEDEDDDCSCDQSEKNDNEETDLLLPASLKQTSKLSTVPLFEGAPLSMKASWLACQHFALSNHLSDAAAQQLTELIRMHRPSDEHCAKSTYQLRNQIKFNLEVESKTFCSLCKEEINEVGKMCSKSKCKSKNSGVCYLAVLPFHSHLHTIFTEKWQEICTHFESLQHERTTIKDIHNGEVFRSLRGEGKFLCVPEHTGLILSCDGVPAFKSSDIRYNAEYTMTAALWLGPCKPPMKLILPPVLSIISKLENNGMEFLTPQGPKILKAKLLVGDNKLGNASSEKE
ncbi:hypothetical protein EMCRGX_G013356 [Ephydatia muelleri]